MTVGIMQPYFLPYLGYWQLLAAVDRFVIYDNIQYTKKGWINRNRFLQNGRDEYFTVPLKKASDYLTVAEREVAADFNRDKLLRTLSASYRRAPQFDVVFPIVERIVRSPLTNLFDYVFNSVVEVAAVLQIATPIVISSSMAIDHSLKSEEKVVALCRAIGAGRYLNPIGGQSLYSRSAFAAASIELAFLHARPITYAQGDSAFVPNLSIVDVLMFNPLSTVRAMLGEADVIPAV
jgi:hypothetical protein